MLIDVKRIAFHSICFFWPSQPMYAFYGGVHSDRSWEPIEPILSGVLLVFVCALFIRSHKSWCSEFQINKIIPHHVIFPHLYIYIHFIKSNGILWFSCNSIYCLQSFFLSTDSVHSDCLFGLFVFIFICRLSAQKQNKKQLNA